MPLSPGPIWTTTALWQIRRQWCWWRKWCCCLHLVSQRSNGSFSSTAYLTQLRYECDDERLQKKKKWTLTDSQSIQKDNMLTGQNYLLWSCDCEHFYHGFKPTFIFWLVWWWPEGTLWHNSRTSLLSVLLLSVCCAPVSADLCRCPDQWPNFGDNRWVPLQKPLMCFTHPHQSLL